jgi:hypothetical protein
MNKNYDLIITKISRPHIKHVLARQLAANPSISHQKALSLLENLPIVYMRDLSIKELEEAVAHLHTMGVESRAIEAKSPVDSPGTIKIPDDAGSTITSHMVEMPLVTSSLPKVPVVQKRSAAFYSSSGPMGAPVPIKPKKKNRVLGVILIIGVGLALLLYFNNKRKYVITATRPLISKQGQREKKIPASQGAGSDFSGVQEKQPGKANGQKHTTAFSQQEASESYRDSAEQAGDDYESAIRFYRMAISFNQYNYQAWQGLLTAYRGARKTEDVAETEKEMEKLFGEQVFSIGEIVASYGELVRYKRDENNVCRLEYRSLSKKRTEIEQQTFLIIRALISRESCAQVSLFASTGTGTGLLVRVPAVSFPATLSGYKDRAELSFTE